MSEPINYKSILSELKSRLIELDTEKARIETAISVIAPLAGVHLVETTTLPGLQPDTEDTKIVPNEFAGDTGFEAAEKYLAKIGTPQQTRTICEALLKGGFKTTSEKLYSTIYTTMDRHKETFVKGDKGWWGLFVWDE